MRWPVFAIAAFLGLGLEIGLRGLVHLGAASPSFLLILVIYVGLSAPPLTVGWAALVLGLLTDLSAAAPMDGRPLDILGPAALGFLLAGYTALQFRGLVFRGSAITVAMTVFFGGLMAQLMIVAVLTIRGLDFVPGEMVAGWDAPEQLVRRFFDLLYTTAWALPVGKLLMWTDPLWGFPMLSKHRRN
ncbi:MAG: hypothetical protein IT443_03770 [Phycisphaeraceae bacterium]|nr:hypothetical protein [Phycisphaeraceae bacterium]